MPEHPRISAHQANARMVCTARLFRWPLAALTGLTGYLLLYFAWPGPDTRRSVSLLTATAAVLFLAALDLAMNLITFRKVIPLPSLARWYAWLGVAGVLLLGALLAASPGPGSSPHLAAVLRAGLAVIGTLALIAWGTTSLMPAPAPDTGDHIHTPPRPVASPELLDEVDTTPDWAK